MRVLYISAIVVVLDQATKLFVKGFTLPFFHHEGMQLGSSLPMLGDALRLTYIENPGKAFGIEVGSQLYLALFSLLASAGVFYYLFKVREEPFVIRASLALILGGAIGNLIDRVFYGVLFDEAPLFYGKVVDFIDVNVLHLSRFGIFNIADAAVSTGVVLLLVFHRRAELASDRTTVTVDPNSRSDSKDIVADGNGRKTDTPLELESVRKKQV